MCDMLDVYTMKIERPVGCLKFLCLFFRYEMCELGRSVAEWDMRKVYSYSWLAKVKVDIVCFSQLTIAKKSGYCIDDGAS
jgi:hypothetical protein